MKSQLYDFFRNGLIVFLGLLGSLSLFAQNQIIQFKNHTIDKGLSQSVVNGVYVDEKGIAWIATADGLNRYDGFSYEVFKANRHDPNSLSSSIIAMVVGVDSKNNIWLATADRKLNKFNLKTNINEVVGANIPDSVGFNNAFVIEMVEGQKSDVWFTNLSGFYNYDTNTKEFKRYAHDPKDSTSLASNVVWAASYDSDNNLWVGTKNGISRYVSENDSFKNYIVPAQYDFRNEIIKFILDEHGSLFAVSRNAVYLYEKEKDDFKMFHLETEEPHPVVNDVEYDSLGKIWIAGNYGLFVFDIAQKSVMNYKFDGLKTRAQDKIAVCDIYKDNLGMLWMASGQGLIKHDLKQNSHQIFTQAEEDGFTNFMYKVYEDFEHNIWVVHRPMRVGARFSRFNRKAGVFENIHHHPFFEQSATSEYTLVTSFLGNHKMPYQDRNKNIWFGFYGTGVSQYAPIVGYFEKYVNNPLDEKSIHGGVWGFCEDDMGMIWISQIEFGISSFKKETGNIERQIPHNQSDSQALQSDWITSMHKDNSGQIWMAAVNNGVGVLNPKTGATYNFSENCSDPELKKRRKNVKYLTIDSKERVWIILNFYGIIIYDIENKTYQHINHKNTRDLTDGQILSVYEDKQGYIWLIGDDVQKYNPQTNEFLAFEINDNKKYLNVDEALSGMQDAHGNMWFATSGHGICKYDQKNEKLFYYDETDGLSNNFVYGIVEDNSQNLWLSTNYGLTSFNPKSEKFKTYDVNDGLQSNEFNSNSYYKDSEGKLYFGGLNGFNCFFPDEIQIDTIPPQIVLSNLKIQNRNVHVFKSQDASQTSFIDKNSVFETDDRDFFISQKIEYTDTLKLEYWQKSISFEMIGLGNFNPEENIYKYKLENFDEAWNFSGNRRFVSYTNLPPGEYTFKAFAANSDGLWSKEPAELHISIEPPFWQLLWFKVMAVFALVFLVYFFYRIKIRQIKNQNVELERTVELRTQEIRAKNKELEQQKEEIIVQRDEIEKHRKNLEQKVQERTKELQGAKVKAEESDRLKTEFLHNMSHEVRTPLNGILGFSRLLSNDNLNRTKFKSYINVIQASGMQLLRIIDDILEMSKLATNQANVRTKFVCINELLREQHAYFSTKSENLPIKLNTALSDKQSVISTDELKLKKILRSLLENALKYTKEGYVEVGYNLRKNGIGQKIEIYVKDTGIGIRPESQKGIFDCFAQEEKELAKNVGGMGLGLSIAKNNAELLGGTIRLESEKGKGSTFFVTIPYEKVEEVIAKDLIKRNKL
jgi:signal transduction histidine kinase/ligand-binding sensor domain-containing protein